MPSEKDEATATGNINAQKIGEIWMFLRHANRHTDRQIDRDNCQDT